jgi:hypothetical protein
VFVIVLFEGWLDIAFDELFVCLILSCAYLVSEVIFLVVADLTGGVVLAVITLGCYCFGVVVFD